MDYALKFALTAAAAFMVGFLAAVYVERPPPGWVCREVTWSTFAGVRREARRCDAADGWHIEYWQGLGQVAVPDRSLQRRPPMYD
jgi:hypothetical protein